MRKTKDPKQYMCHRVTINLTEPEHDALVALAKSWGDDTPRKHLQNYIRQQLLKHRLSAADQEAQKC